MKNFVAIDVETATAERCSICEIGITEVVDGAVKLSKSWLVQPEDNEYDEMNMLIHGITPEDTKNSPAFPQVWEEVKGYLQDKIVVAHNTSFDMFSLRDAFDKYDIEYPSFDYFCTLRIARYVIKGCYSYSLNTVLEHLKIEIGEHHRAKDDSLGCAMLLLKCLEMDGCELDELESKYNFHRGKFAPNTFISHLAISKRTEGYKEYIKNLEVNKVQNAESNYFYGKTICFTGTCRYGVRKDLLRKVAEIGAVPMDSVTAKTNVLVVGQQDYKRVGDSGMSSKQKKAMSLLEKGCDIEILSEVEFLSRI